MRRLTGVLLLSLTIPAASFSQTAQEPGTFLRRYARLSDAQVRELEKGGVVARLLDPHHPTEIVPFGGELIRIPVPFFQEKYRDIARFKKAREVLQIGKFSRPPRREDLDPLALDEDEVNSLRNCRPGDCAFKATAGMIRRLQSEVHWSGRDSVREANVLFRQLLWEQLRDYLAKGNAALPVYRDKAKEVRLEEEFKSLVEASPYLNEYVPELRRYLLEFPSHPSPEVEDIFYWSKEKFGYKPVISITHATMYRMAQAESDVLIIASKQVYANHYFTASLGLAALVEKKGAGANPSGYLFYLNRSRADLPGGILSGLVRYFVRKRVVDGLEKYLVLIRQRFEAEYSAARAR